MTPGELAQRARALLSECDRGAESYERQVTLATLAALDAGLGRWVQAADQLSAAADLASLESRRPWLDLARDVREQARSD